jgi:hypothetical protein
MANQTYSEKLKDPRWQQRRLQIIERDKYTCQQCLQQDSTLHVHHKFYKENREPWEYEDKDLITLCADCHQLTHALFDRDKRLHKNMLSLYGESAFDCLACGSDQFRIKGLDVICKICGWNKNEL